MTQNNTNWSINYCPTTPDIYVKNVVLNSLIFKLYKDTVYHMELMNTSAQIVITKLLEETIYADIY